MAQKREYIVYKHTCPNGKVYIGITCQPIAKRFSNGYGYKRQTHFYNAIKKYGWDNIKHEIVATGLSKKAAAAMEQELIFRDDTMNPEKGYNCTSGGDFGFVFSEATRKKLSEAHKGIPLNEERRKKLVEGRKNKGFSAETREKISKAHTGRRHTDASRHNMSEAHKGNPSPMKGKHHDETTKKKISIANKGKPSPMKGKQHSDAARAKMSAASKGRPAANRKSVVCIDTGIIYDSATEAATATGTQTTNIIKVCNGKRSRTGGYVWRYA